METDVGEKQYIDDIEAVALFTARDTNDVLATAIRAIAAEVHSVANALVGQAGGADL